MVDSIKSYLIVPVYNEASRWDRDYWEEIADLPLDKIIFVNDGSTDNSLLLMKELNSDKFSILNLEVNVGKSEALRKGFLKVFEKSNAECIVGFMDSDGAFKPKDVSNLIENLKREFRQSGIRSCWSSRVSLQGSEILRTQKRHYIGRIIVTFLSLGIRNFPYDTQSGLKFYVLDNTDIKPFEARFRTRWFFDIELWIRLLNHYSLKLSPFNVKEVPLSYWKDVGGSNIAGLEILRVLRELIVIRRLLKNSLR